MVETLLTKIKHYLGEFVAEWKARRSGRQHLPNDLYRATRDIVGPLGLAASESWDQLTQNQSAYMKSFDRDRVPPSLHVSNRDKLRLGQVMPLQERCIEDFGKEESDQPQQWRMEDLGSD